MSSGSFTIMGPSQYIEIRRNSHASFIKLPRTYQLKVYYLAVNKGVIRHKYRHNVIHLDQQVVHKDSQ